jgi:hypothetical protein
MCFVFSLDISTSKQLSSIPQLTVVSGPILSVTMSSVPMTLVEDRKPYQSEKVSKTSKLGNRSSKRSNASRAESSMLMNRRHGRVWEACQRCRVKKTKACQKLSTCLTRTYFFFSVTKNCLAKGVKMTDSCAQPEVGRREILSNSLAGMIAFADRLHSANTKVPDMPRS